MPHKITGLIHHPYTPPTGFKAITPPVHRASTVFFDQIDDIAGQNWRAGEGYSYGLHGTPTTFTLQQRIASLEGGQHCLLMPSGLAAISLVNLSLLQQGDHVLVPANAYGPTADMITQVLGAKGIDMSFYDPMQPQTLTGAIRPQTKLVWLEAPGSVTLEFPNLARLVQIAQQHQLLTVLDNTWGAGLAFSGFHLPDNTAVDVVVQALTKYPSGGGDVLMGSVVTCNPRLHQQLKATQQYLGINVAANDAELVLRSLPSIEVRYSAQDHSARQLAQWLQGQPQVKKVLHPSLPDSPGHQAWLETTRTARHPDGQAAGLVSFVLDDAISQAQVHQFCEQLKLFKIGFSWGGPVSLVMPYQLSKIRPAGFVPAWGENLVRLCAGLETPADLQADLAQALKLLT